MLKYTLILGSIMVFLTLVLFLLTKKRKSDEIKRIEKRAAYLANSERAKHMKKTM